MLRVFRLLTPTVEKSRIMNTTKASAGEGKVWGKEGSSRKTLFQECEG